ncbi:MAG: cation:proton antiporter [Prevotella sp.]
MKLHFLEDFYTNYGIDSPTQVVITLGMLFIVAFLLTRITKKIKLPNVTAYILAGILIGPYILNLIPGQIITDMSFVTDVGLGFIAFSSGRYFNLSMIKHNGWKPVIMALMESILTSAVVFLVMLPFNIPIGVALIIASIGGTTSSASTLMTIRQYKCTGSFVDYVVELNALDNVLGILSFSVCSGIALALLGVSGETGVFNAVWLPILVNLGLIGIGFLAGLFLSKVVITPTRSKDNRLILTVAGILLLVGLCGLTNIIDDNLFATPLLCVMAFAASYINFTGDDEIFEQVSDFGAPIILIFFVLSGVKFNISYLGTVGLIGIIYFLVRFAVKYGSSYLGALVVKSDKTITKYVGMTMIPQAGISIGLAAIVLRMLTGNYASWGEQINAIIVFAGILYEIVGPALAKLALKLSGSLTEETKGKFKKGQLVVESESMLRDVAPIEDEEAYHKKMAEFNSMKNELDEANRYIHTTAYKESGKNKDS